VGGQPCGDASRAGEQVIQRRVRKSLVVEDRLGDEDLELADFPLGKINPGGIRECGSDQVFGPSGVDADVVGEVIRPELRDETYDLPVAGWVAEPSVECQNKEGGQELRPSLPAGARENLFISIECFQVATDECSRELDKSNLCRHYDSTCRASVLLGDS
jgi:hypothetical protein